jgi:hypothetical protein
VQLSSSTSQTEPLLQISDIAPERGYGRTLLCILLPKPLAYLRIESIPLFPQTMDNQFRTIQVQQRNMKAPCLGQWLQAACLFILAHLRRNIVIYRVEKTLPLRYLRCVRKEIRLYTGYTAYRHRPDSHRCHHPRQRLAESDQP